MISLEEFKKQVGKDSATIEDVYKATVLLFFSDRYIVASDEEVVAEIIKRLKG